MEIKQPFQVKHLKKVQPGELIDTAYGAKRALSMILEVDNTGYLIRALLKVDALPKDAVPFRDRSKPDEYCLSYGDDWDLQLLPGPETFPGNVNAQEVPGTINISDARVTLYLAAAPDEARSTAAHIDLATFKSVPDIPRHAAPVHAWKIWAKDDSVRVGAIPIFQFPSPGK